METKIKTPEEVEDFLKEAKELALHEELTQVNSAPWADGKVNKTRQYMAETGINKKVILSVVRQLEIVNYSSTKQDRNPTFPGEYVWEFGITKNLIDQEEDLYIKLKIRKLNDKCLLIMSFHPEQPRRPEDKLTFPYGN